MAALMDGSKDAHEADGALFIAQARAIIGNLELLGQEPGNNAEKFMRALLDNCLNRFGAARSPSRLEIFDKRLG